MCHKQQTRILVIGYAGLEILEFTNPLSVLAIIPSASYTKIGNTEIAFN